MYEGFWILWRRCDGGSINSCIFEELVLLERILPDNADVVIPAEVDSLNLKKQDAVVEKVSSNQWDVICR